MHGYAVKLGERQGIPTPALFLVYAALKPYIGGTPTPKTAAVPPVRTPPPIA